MKRNMLTAILISACMFSLRAADISDIKVYRETLNELLFLKREASGSNLPLPCKVLDELDIISAVADNNACDTQAGNDDFKQAKDCYSKGLVKEGHIHLCQAAEKGHIEALLELCKLYLKLGVKDMANKCFCRAAQRGDVFAMKILGMPADTYKPEPRMSEGELYLMAHGIDPVDFARAQEVYYREMLYQYASPSRDRKRKRDASELQTESDDEIRFITGN